MRDPLQAAAVASIRDLVYRAKSKPVMGYRRVSVSVSVALGSQRPQSSETFPQAPVAPGHEPPLAPTCGYVRHRISKAPRRPALWAKSNRGTLSKSSAVRHQRLWDDL